jgi:hypothetical protein
MSSLDQVFFKAHKLIVNVFGLLLTVIGAIYLLVREADLLVAAFRSLTRK